MTVPDATRSRIRKLLGEGRLYREVAALVGVSKCTVGRLAREWGVEAGDVETAVRCGACNRLMTTGNPCLECRNVAANVERIKQTMRQRKGAT